MKHETPFTRWQRYIRIQQIRLAHALQLAGERREYGPLSESGEGRCGQGVSDDFNRNQTQITMTKISELPNTPDYPLRALAVLRRKENTDPVYGTKKKWDTGDAFEWDKTRENLYFWRDVFNINQHPPIPAESIEDLRKAGMMPELFCCENSESTAGPCAKQCAECAVDERAAKRKPNKFYCHNQSVTFTAPACNTQCGVCRIIEDDKPKPSITLEGYARMEREEEINELIQTMLTPSELRGYYMGNIIKYRMRAGKKAFTGEDQSDDLFNARNFEGLLAELERGEG